MRTLLALLVLVALAFTLTDATIVSKARRVSADKFCRQYSFADCPTGNDARGYKQCNKCNGGICQYEDCPEWGKKSAAPVPDSYWTDRVCGEFTTKATCEASYTNCCYSTGTCIRCRG